MAERLPPGARRDLAEYLLQSRREQDLTQRQAAEVLGIDASQISKWESGENIPRSERIGAIADVYGIRESALQLHVMLAIEEERLDLREQLSKREKQHAELLSRLDETEKRWSVATAQMEHLIAELRSARGQDAPR